MSLITSKKKFAYHLLIQAWWEVIADAQEGAVIQGWKLLGANIYGKKKQNDTSASNGTP